MTTFTAEAYQNEYLPAGGGEVNAVLTVTASDAAPAATSTQAAEIIIVDVSGSMGSPRAKLSAATRATAVAIDCIRDGVMFGVIAGNDTARAVYPQEGQLVPASPQTRADAKRAVARLRATGGTAIGSWLALAKELLAAAPEAIRHAILLTDGQDEH
jgi:Mg-chelatase subunit ChlD